MPRSPKLPEASNCPCCGGEAWAYRTGSWGLVRCVKVTEGRAAKGCGLRLETSQGLEVAIERWNARQGLQTALIGAE